MHGAYFVVLVRVLSFILYRRLVVSTMPALLCGQEIPRGTPSRLHFWCQHYKGLPHIKTAFVLIYFLFLVLLVFQTFHVKFLWFWNVCEMESEWPGGPCIICGIVLLFVHVSEMLWYRKSPDILHRFLGFQFYYTVLSTALHRFHCSSFLCLPAWQSKCSFVHIQYDSICGQRKL